MTSVKIKQQSRNSLAMKITPNGVEVLIPRQLSPNSEQVQDFIGENLHRLTPSAPDGSALRQDEAISKSDILALVEQWADQLDVAINRMQLRRMRQKWGSISTAGTLTLADDLLKLPRHLVEYVICHELLHLKVPHHNKLYYLLLEQHIPDWRGREQALGRWVLALEQKEKTDD